MIFTCLILKWFKKLESLFSDKLVAIFASMVKEIPWLKKNPEIRIVETFSFQEKYLRIHGLLEMSVV